MCVRLMKWCKQKLKTMRFSGRNGEQEKNLFFHENFTQKIEMRLRCENYLSNFGNF